MTSTDWLGLCRRVVAEQKEIFKGVATSVARTEYEGVGEGGDATLVIDRLCEDVVFAELEAYAARDGRAMLAISEERGEVRFNSAAGEEPVLRVVIDPIDGSLNARRLIPAHSFCLAVASGAAMTEVEFGYVYDFGSGQEFEAARGGGARCDGLSLPPLPAPSGDSRLEVVGLESADPEIAGPVMEALAGRVHRLRVVGSIAITVCQVAAGRFDGMLSLRSCRSVDVAAAQLILSEAGGELTLGDTPLAERGLGLEERYPVAAAGDRAGLELMRAAQRQVAAGGER